MNTRSLDILEKKPRFSCAGIVLRHGRVLLGKRAKEPNRDFWVLPGGKARFGEHFVETLQRELFEETGTTILPLNFFKLYELVDPPHEHRVIAYFYAKYLSGTPKAASDLREVRFFGKKELKKLHAEGRISAFVATVLADAGLLTAGKYDVARRHNKLVRDKIPEELKRRGIPCTWRIASKEEYLFKLLEKLTEEVEELHRARTPEELTSELADILEVVTALKKRYRHLWPAVLRVRRVKLSRRGGFTKGIILEES